MLGFRAAEAAAILDTSQAAVNSLLQRARADARATACPPRGATERRCPTPAREREVVGRFADALEDGDIDAVVTLLTDDAWLTMPPYPYEYQGGAAIENFLRVRGARHDDAAAARPHPGQRSTRVRLLLPVPANRIARAYGLLVLTLAGSNIAEITFFADSGVFPHFGLPRTVPKQRG